MHDPHLIALCEQSQLWAGENDGTGGEEGICDVVIGQVGGLIGQARVWGPDEQS